MFLHCENAGRQALQTSQPLRWQQTHRSSHDMDLGQWSATGLVTNRSKTGVTASAGWGVPAAPEVVGTPRARGGRGRGGRGRRGRGKGGRRGGRGYRRGRGYSYDEDLEESDSDFGYAEPELPAPTTNASKIVVEQIYGWRWPLSEQEKAVERLVPPLALATSVLWKLVDSQPLRISVSNNQLYPRSCFLPSVLPRASPTLVPTSLCTLNNKAPPSPCRDSAGRPSDIRRRTARNSWKSCGLRVKSHPSPPASRPVQPSRMRGGQCRPQSLPWRPALETCLRNWRSLQARRLTRGPLQSKRYTICSLLLLAAHQARCERHEIEQTDGVTSLRPRRVPSHRTPLHCSACGAVFMAVSAAGGH